MFFKVFFKVILFCLVTFCLICGCQDEGRSSASDINPPNQQLKAKIASEVSGKLNERIWLDARGSIVEEARAMTYDWEMTAFPAGANVVLESKDVRKGTTRVQGNIAFFTGDLEGDYTVRLTVNDGTNVATTTKTIYLDVDGDGVPTAQDLDRDGDGILNQEDAFPDNPGEFLDSDINGTGNFAQTDEDDDGTLDENDFFPFDNTQHACPEFTETKEPGGSHQNDQIANAEDTQKSYPLIIYGSIHNNADEDVYKIQANASDFVTFAIKKGNRDFVPTISAFDRYGNPLPTILLELSGYVKTIALQVPEGENSIYLVASNEDSTGDPAYQYEVFLYKDSDLDGLSDDLEIAIGSNTNMQDSDGDGILDGQEYYADKMDLDADGIPNWLDWDSDNDGIPDRIEGIADNDSDGLPNFLDTDSDGNTIEDSTEIASVPTFPLDTDKDTEPDFSDTDDDNDGILDINDSQRLVAAVAEDHMNLNSFAVESVGCEVARGTYIEGATYSGGTLVVKGRNFAALAEENIILLIGANKIFNLIATEINQTATELKAILPSISPGTLAIKLAKKNQHAITNALQMAILKSSEPMITGFNPLVVQGGANLTINGFNLGAGIPATVYFNGASQNVTPGNDQSFSVVVPTNAKTGHIYMFNSRGQSNIAFLIVQEAIQGTITLPQGSVEDIQQIVLGWDANGDEVHPNADGTFNGYFINQQEANLLNAITGNNPPSTYLMGLYLPGDANATLDAQTTALALLWSALQIDQVILKEDWGICRNLINALQSKNALGDLIAQLLPGNPTLLRDFDASEPLKTALIQALIASNQAVLTAIQNGDVHYKNAQRTKARRQRREIDSAIVTPPQQHDIAVYEDDPTFGPPTGAIIVENDTQLYLSGKFIEKDSKKELNKHTNGYFDGEMVGPQGAGLLFWASTKNYSPIPNRHDCTLEVLTPGGASPKAETSEEKACVKALWWRTVIDRILFPTINYVMGLVIDAKFDGNDVLKVLMDKAPNMIDIVATKVANGDIGGAFGDVLNVLKDDALQFPPGPITEALVKKLAADKIQNMTQAALEILIKKFGAKLVPGIGTLQLAWQALGAINTVANVGKCIKDMNYVPGKLSYDIKFPLQIESVDPPEIRARNKDDIPTNIDCTIKGSGFAEITHWFSATERPKVKFYHAGRATITVDPYYINQDGTEMKARIPRWFFLNGDDVNTKNVHIEVEHRGVKAEKQDAIVIVNDISITSITPGEASPGDSIVLAGAGFSTQPLKNKVSFIGSQTKVGTVVNASASALSVIVPNFTQEETVQVQVEIEQDVSNQKEFKVVLGEVEFTLGDNGSANDDTYSLGLDGITVYTMPSPHRPRVVARRNLAPGSTHTVKATGITAPDAIGTYLVGFSSNVEVISGPSLSGDDLTAGVVKTWSIRIKTQNPTKYTIQSKPRVFILLPE